MKTLRIDVWSDIACPWCYVGKRHLEDALGRFEQRKDVEVVWRAFELDPTVREASQVGQAERLAGKYGMTVADATRRLAAMTELGAKDGVEFRFDRIRSVNTFKAHRLLHLGLLRGRQNELKERLMRAYMSEGVDLSDDEQLVRLAGEAGLDTSEAKAVLASNAHADDVRADEGEAQELGIHGVPFFLIGRYGVSGAQPADVLLEVLQKAWQEVPETSTAVAAAETCGVDGCV